VSDSDDPILAIFERRKTIRDISPTPLSMQELSNGPLDPAGRSSL
jgi:hypothetical protein